LRHQAIGLAELVHVAAGDQAQCRVVQRRQQAAARRRRQEAATEIGLGRRGIVERLVDEECDRTAVGGRCGMAHEVALVGIGGQVGAGELRVDADQPPAGHVVRPVVLAEDRAVAGAAILVDRLLRADALAVADVVVAGNCQPVEVERLVQAVRAAQVGVEVGAVERDIAAVDH
jgi:hypothetical protein